ncbi:MAG TPA: LLM class F420-dependent oxidoreductase, partial [Ktedonosporobacter sp.]|nr:LLM class F420-dependent oxidoreductase [Ktedonosporobacter sp.]
GREADIIAIGSRVSGHGADPTDATLEQKITWLKEGAGARFVDLELAQTIYDRVLTDSGAEVSAQTGGWSIPKRQMSTEQASAQLLEERERYGVSYLQVYDGQMENFAPVVAQLSGK